MRETSLFSAFGLVSAFGLGLACVGTASPARAASEISAEIGTTGLVATEARLASLAAPTDADRFALGGVRFLRGVERTLQLRWRHGMNSRFSELPILRLPIEPNPAAEPFRPELISQMFSGLLDDMTATSTALAPIAQTSGFGLEVALADLWFDIDADGQRDEREDLFEVVGPLLMGRSGGPPPLEMTVRFDAADVAWLDAYAHLLSGLSDVLLAYDPTAAVKVSMDTNAAYDTLNTDLQMLNALVDQVGFFVDRAAIIEDALNQAPDAAHARSAQTHFLAVVGRNRDLWRMVAAETDDAAEWIPNDRQQSALGLTLPPGTGETWLAVLGDAEAMLQGRLLVPYWRLGDGAGLNIGRMFTDPRAIDLVDWVQGSGALPYAERGQRVGTDNLRRFEALFSGDATLFAVFLN